MPKSTRKRPIPEDDPVVIAAKVNRSGTIRNGLIAGTVTLLVAIIGITNRFCDQQTKPEPEREKLVIKVLDNVTGKGISGAKVSLEGSDVPALNTTDSNGIISFPISGPKKELRIRVEAEGYEKDFNLRISPSHISGTQEIRLRPLSLSSPVDKATLATQPPSPAAREKSLPTRIPQKPEGNRLVIRGMVMDETGATLPGVRITIAGHGSATTDASGNFQIQVAVSRGRLIDLNITKEGYRTKTIAEQASDDTIKIVLRR